MTIEGNTEFRFITEDDLVPLINGPVFDDF